MYSGEAQLWGVGIRPEMHIAQAPSALTKSVLRSVFKISCLFLRPRPWQFEIRDSTDT